MALTYDLTAVKDWKEKYPATTYQNGEEGMNEITNMLIFVSMITGIREITSKNAQEVFSRIRMSEMVHGGYFSDGNGGYRNATLKEVTDHIGLKTNASDITKAKFNGYMNKQMREKIEREVS
tara:strand:- start:256 stop:621 length:366 start_codon:yes stop_codon:yes gene_type:complete